MKIYTGSGDRGKTSLFSGERVMKTHPRIELGGEIDELNSILGAVLAKLPIDDKEGIDELTRIQSYLLQAGAVLSTIPDSPIFKEIEPLTQTHIAYLESAIDKMDQQLPELKSFILPGGHISAVWSHMARAVCRRVERRVVQLTAVKDTEPPVQALETLLVFFNRLSDYLFMKARRCNQIMRVPDNIWKK